MERRLWKLFSFMLVCGSITLLYYLFMLDRHGGFIVEDDRSHDILQQQREIVSMEPLEMDKPVYVLTLGYQRTASSVIGQIVGNLENQFFLYEPLDMTYTALYGTAPGWNVPSEIFNTEKGVLRPLSQDELRAIAFTLDTIFNCEMGKKWPVQFLMHPFTLARGRREYPNCVKSKISQDHALKSVGLKGLSHCLGLIKTLCKGRFQPSSTKLQKCKQMMYSNSEFRTEINPDELIYGFSVEEKNMFNQYFNCLKKYEPIARECAVTHLDSRCQKSETRIVKTVRATMDVPEFFFEKYSNFRLIHLFRDPRGTAKSRSDAKWSNGGYERHLPLNIAQLYCQNVLSDYKKRQQLEKEYPGRTVQVISDDFMAHSSLYVDKIINLISKNISEIKSIVTKRLSNSGIEYRTDFDGSNSTEFGLDSLVEAPLEGDDESKKKNEKPVALGKRERRGESRIQYWQEAFNFKLVHDIQDICADFFREIHFDWDNLIE